MSTRREILVGGTVGSALAGLGLAACATSTAGHARAGAASATAAGAPAAAASAPPAAPANTPAAGGPPWLKRAFHMYTGQDGQSAIRALDLPAPQALASQWLLRRPAERVTMGSMAPGFMLDFHVANQPNILVPLFGTLLVKLRDGSVWSFGHGDILFAEDCSGGGHVSGAGPEGCFSVSVQLPKSAHCLDPQAAPADVLAGRGEPRY